MRISDWSSDVCSSDLVVARAVADRARRVDARHEQQFDADEALALAVVAATLGDIARKAAGIVTALACLRGGGEKLAHVVEIGRASCRERVCQYVAISGGAVTLTQIKNTQELKI